MNHPRPTHAQHHDHEIAIRMAALNPAVQELITSVKVARHHLKHGRVEAADRVLRQAGGRFMTREVIVAYSGSVLRSDTCSTCGEPMLYRVDATERVISSFCGSMTDCAAALIEIPE